MLARITTLLYSKGLKTASCVFFQNDTNRRFFTDKKLYTGKAVLVPGSGVNLTEHPYEEYPDEGNGINLLFIGRIMKDKGIDELLTAAEQIKQRHSNVDFTLIGQYDESYQNKVEEAQRCKNVDYLGFQSDVHSFIKNAHVAGGLRCLLGNYRNYSGAVPADVRFRSGATRTIQKYFIFRKNTPH